MFAVNTTHVWLFNNGWIFWSVFVFGLIAYAAVVAMHDVMMELMDTEIPEAEYINDLYEQEYDVYDSQYYLSLDERDEMYATLAALMRDMEDDA